VPVYLYAPISRLIDFWCCATAPAFFFKHKKIPAVTGRATVGGNPVAMQRALGFVSHAYQNMRAHHIACRWHMVKFHSHDAGVSVNVNVGVAPKSHGHVPMGNAVLCRNGIVGTWLCVFFFVCLFVCFFYSSRSFFCPLLDACMQCIRAHFAVL
jgi:hypothetical protein